MSKSWPDSHDTTVVVWGATGFIGRNLLAYLKPRVARLIAVCRSPASIEGVESYTQVDLPQTLGGRVVAINLAAERYDASRFQHYQSYIFLRNVEIATQFYHFCLEHDIKEARVASSIAVYAEGETLLDDSIPLKREVLPATSEAMYGCSKRITEDVAALYHAKYGINTLLFRLSNPYGPYDSVHMDKAHVLAAFVMRALTTTGPFMVRGGPDATRDFIFVQDVCDILHRSLALHDQHGAYNLATGINTKVVELAQLVLKHTDPIRAVQFEGTPTSSVVHRVCKVERLKQDFGLTDFSSLEQGLIETIKWYRTQVA